MLLLPKKILLITGYEGTESTGMEWSMMRMVDTLRRRMSEITMQTLEPLLLNSHTHGFFELEIS